MSRKKSMKRGLPFRSGLRADCFRGTRSECNGKLHSLVLHQNVTLGNIIAAEVPKQ